MPTQEKREFPVQCLHSHSHTNRTLDSLNNADPPPLQGPHKLAYALAKVKGSKGDPAQTSPGPGHGPSGRGS